MSWFAQRMVPCRSRSQCSDVSCGRNYGHCGRPLSCLSQERRFVSDSATVLRGLERGPKWCTAARGPHADVWRRIWECVRDVGDEAHIDSVSKCKALLSESEQAKLDEAGRLTTADAWADELAKEGIHPVRYVQSSCRNKQGYHWQHWSHARGPISSSQSNCTTAQPHAPHLPAFTSREGVSSNMTLEALCWRAPAFVLLRVPLFHTEVTLAPLTFTERVRDDLSLSLSLPLPFLKFWLCAHTF